MEIVTGVAANVPSGCTYMLHRIKRGILYVLGHERIVESFEEQLQILMDRIQRVQYKVEVAVRNGEEIHSDVNYWLIEADKMINIKAKEVKDLEDKANKNCFIGLCPNFKSRYQLSRKAERNAGTVDELLGQGSFDRVSYHLTPEPIVHMPIRDFKYFQSRTSIMKEILVALRDPDLNIVGVYGMGGVGKTTLVKEVGRKAKEAYLFDEVVMATVSQDLDIRDIQNQIADMLGLKLESETDSGRAMELNRRWRRAGMKVLVILDDIWEKVDLDVIGLTFEDDKKIGPDRKQGSGVENIGGSSTMTTSGGIKILLTSRSYSLICGMNAEKKFQCGTLSREEAMDLFATIVGDAVNKPSYKSIANQIVAQCAGLPVAVSTIAHALKNTGLDAWRDALWQLIKLNPANMEAEAAYSAIELSYRLLKDMEARSLFELCALQRQVSGINLRYLLRYGLGMHLFEDVNTLEEARKRVSGLVNKLKVSSLLLSGDNDQFVEMHDVVHDVALQIVAKEKQMFVIEDGVRMRHLREGKLVNCTAISLPFSTVHDLPVLDCPKLKLLLLFVGQDFPLQVPDMFFKKMNDLQVLHLTGMHFASLPSSFLFLINLKTLCLELCKLGDITIIANLKKLDILSFDGSEIKQLPNEIGELTELRLLDLSNCSKLEVIPANIISRLSLLEELYIGNSFDRWDVEGNASLSELKHLHRLTALHIHVRDSQILPKDLFPATLVRYRIVIGDTPWDWLEEYECSRTLRLKVNTRFDYDHGIRMLLTRTEDLYVNQLKGFKSLLYELDHTGFPFLKHLHVKNSSEIQYIIGVDREVANETINKMKLHGLQSITLECLPDLVSFCHPKQIDSTTSSLPLFTEKIVFPCLEMLHLSSLNIQRIWHDPFVEAFKQLKRVEIYNCSSLRYIFSTSMVMDLKHLEILEICNCKILEEVVITSEASQEEIPVMSFPRLVSLRLVALPQLTRFCSGHYFEFESLKELWIESCPLLGTFVSSFEGGRTISKGKVDWNNSGKNLQQAYQLALFDEKVKFPSLEKLAIIDMQNLKRISRDQLSVGSFCGVKVLKLTRLPEQLTSLPPCFPPLISNLKELVVGNACLKELFHSDGAGEEINDGWALARFCELRLFRLPRLAHIWKEEFPPGELFQELTTLKVSECSALKILVPSSVSFPNLTTLEILKCHGLSNLITSSGAESIAQLQTLKIGHCNKMEEIMAAADDSVQGGSITFKQLKYLGLQALPSLTRFCSAKYTFEFPSLEKITIIDCPKLKNISEVEAKSLQKVCVNEEEDNWHWAGDLNRTINELLAKKDHQVPELGFEQWSLSRLWEPRYVKIGQ